MELSIFQCELEKTEKDHFHCPCPEKRRTTVFDLGKVNCSAHSRNIFHYWNNIWPQKAWWVWNRLLSSPGALEKHYIIIITQTYNCKRVSCLTHFYMLLKTLTDHWLTHRANESPQYGTFRSYGYQHLKDGPGTSGLHSLTVLREAVDLHHNKTFEEGCVHLWNLRPQIQRIVWSAQLRGSCPMLADCILGFVVIQL